MALGPNMPTGLRITQNFFTPENITVLFEWDPPQGLGPEEVVDYYRITISPAPLSHPSINSVNSSVWNVTLAYNTPYTANTTAVNCAGKSPSITLEGILFGMLHITCLITELLNLKIAASCLSCTKLCIEKSYQRTSYC